MHNTFLYCSVYWLFFKLIKCYQAFLVVYNYFSQLLMVDDDRKYDLKYFWKKEILFNGLIDCSLLHEQYFCLKQIWAWSPKTTMICFPIHRQPWCAFWQKNDVVFRLILLTLPLKHIMGLWIKVNVVNWWGIALIKHFISCIRFWYKCHAKKWFLDVWLSAGQIQHYFLLYRRTACLVVPWERTTKISNAGTQDPTVGTNQNKWQRSSGASRQYMELGYNTNCFAGAQKGFRHCVTRLSPTRLFLPRVTLLFLTRLLKE